MEKKSQPIKNSQIVSLSSLLTFPTATGYCLTAAVIPRPSHRMVGWNVNDEENPANIQNKRACGRGLEGWYDKVSHEIAVRAGCAGMVGEERIGRRSTYTRRVYARIDPYGIFREVQEAYIL